MSWSLVEPVVDDLDVVHQADEHVRVQLLDLVEVERAEEAVPPAERRVRVDDDVGVVLGRAGLGDNVLERCAAK